ncbi:hypothetical protein SmJEL517_g00010 [Synchytrium microbalum]|uniref:Alpha/beta hydrolase fold-3 domain-containing protein n=1 Tax=Synchytrium microbalum TaxID=1806994 RepID=A0A507CGA2_9FUNG|nr:uncharacterized protein SmJEL517_g00010 [Synchytrium microbalum]TPX38229.1 hypothetical protein SmJEL517_g00010 [Synchytrium microbalum]
MAKDQFPQSWGPKLRHVMTKQKQAMKPNASVLESRKLAETVPYKMDGIDLREVQIPRIHAPSLEANVSGIVPAEFVAVNGSNFDSSLPHILYLHGGGYTQGSKESHRVITMRLAKYGIRVLSVSYRLAPEHPYPAALADAYASFKYLLASGVPASRIVVSGDSAGGGLSYALAMYLRDMGEDMPGGLAPLTPWVDLSHFSPAMNINELPESADVIQSNDIGSETNMSDAYCGGEWAQIYVSPILDVPHSSKRKLPPQFIITGTVDRFQLEDTIMAIRRRRSGETVQLYVFKDMFHVFQAYPFLDASTTAIELEAQFVKDVASGTNLASAYFFVEDDGKTVKEETETAVKARAADIVRRGTVQKTKPLALYKL